MKHFILGLLAFIGLQAMAVAAPAPLTMQIDRASEPFTICAYRQTATAPCIPIGTLDASGNFRVLSAPGSIPVSALVSQSMTVNGTTCTLGSTCTITATAGSIAVGTTGILNSTSGRVLTNNAGNLGDADITTITATPINNAIVADQGTLRGYIAGLTLSNDVGTPATVLDIAAGFATSDDVTTRMTLASAYTKSLNAAWAVGSGNGGLDTGSFSASTWYHVWLIERTDTAVVDVLFSLSATSPTMPANYTKKRRIGSILTSASSQIVAFSQNGDEFLLAAPTNDISQTSTPTSSTLTALASVPPGVKVNALLRGFVSSAGAGALVLIHSPDESAQTPNTPSGNFTVNETAANQGVAFNISVRTNTSRQVRIIASVSNVTTNAVTYGWIDTRGRFN